MVAEIEALDPKITYLKTHLAQMWGIHCNTMRRWVEVATDANTPGFNRVQKMYVNMENLPCYARL